MTLPPALLKRLASRGIINNDDRKLKKNSNGLKTPSSIVTSSNLKKSINSTIGNITTSIINEEVIAEDYDEIEDPSQYDYEPVKKPQESFWIERMKKHIVEGNSSGYKGCPNKSNIYHKCTIYCVNRWGDGVLEPRRVYLKRRNKLLNKYPLQKNWLEIYDYGCGVHYYWNTTDDTVSWLPPSHPKSNITKSASTLRRELDEILPPIIDDDETTELSTLDIQKILDAPLPPIPKRSVSPSNDLPTPTPFKKPKARDLDKALRHNKGRRNRYQKTTTTTKNIELDPLDPMDPSSYSDVPRGKWSDGLGVDTTRTGVDPTASGALFQMRPYPSPGAILRANATRTSKVHSDDDNDDDNE